MSNQRGRARGVLLTILFVLVLAAIGAYVFLFLPVKPKAAEMAPALFPGDTALALRAATPARGDIIAFEHPQQKGVIAARRVIGLPGDTIALRDQRVVLNGQELARQDLGPLTIEDAASRTGHVFARWREDGPGRSWEILLDPHLRSRDLAPITVKDGYFVMADSRNHGRDSREYGVVPAQNVRGVVRYLVSATPVKELGARPTSIR
jgi:signal peptidase I